MTGAQLPIRGDEEARRAIKEDLDVTLVVEAAAGTGKTTELVNRILRVLATGGARIDQIVAVTFTEKAAGELKLRLRERLEQDRASAMDDAVVGRLEDALEKLEEAHVNTIHGFCAELLRERPVEACVDPLFTVHTEPQSARLYDRAFRAWLQETLESPPAGVRRALRRSSGPAFGGAGSDAGGGPVDRLRSAGRALAESRDFPAPWARPPFDRAATIARLVDALHHLAGLTENPSSSRDNFFIDTDAIRRLSLQVRLEQSFGNHDLDGWEARLIDLVRDKGFSRTRKGSGYRYNATVARAEVLATRDALLADLQQFRQDADADLAAALQQELAGATARYQALKNAVGALDFSDLLARTRDLVTGNAAVRQHLQSKFTRIYVDEFQDTDPIQSAILLLLAADNPDETDALNVTPTPGKLFIVGDPKQAIYRFRGTDVATYRRVSRQIEQRGGRVLQLTTSYRSVPEIQRFVNAAFAREMQADDSTLQAAYVPLSESRAQVSSQPSLVALPVPRPYPNRGPLRASAKAIEESLPDMVGAFIAWLVNPANGWTVGERAPDGSESQVPIQPRHIAVLFRRFVSFGTDVTRAYTDAIEARGVPHLLVGGKAFHGREEVETLRAALAAIEWPDDELSVFATLKGSLFAIDDELLLEFKYRFGPVHPFRIPKELGGNSGMDLALTAEPTAHLTPITDALRLLQQLHRSRNYRPVADTVTRLLAETRAHVGFILRPAGEQALANVLHVAELARQYEASGGISFRGFIDELRAAAVSESAEAPILEESSDGVRLMTVHKAKGLEFPVVILADLTCRISRGDASRYLDPEHGLCAMKIGGWAPHELHQHEGEEVARDQAEGVRLAYVAATRARDLLVVPALGDEPWNGGWFGPLNAALYPARDARRTPVRGIKCPAFKSKDSVLQRPDNEPAGLATVCPGSHVFTEGYSVVWWDPGPGGGLQLGAKAPFGVRREELIVKDVPRHVIAQGRTHYDRWRLTRDDARRAGAIPSATLATVGEWAGELESPIKPQSTDGGPDKGRPTSASSASVSSADTVGPAAGTPASGWSGSGGALPEIVVIDLSTGRRRGRSRGAAFGTLVHAVLAQAPLDASPAEMQQVAALQSRVLGMTDADSLEASAIAQRVFSHEIIGRARAAAAGDACRRETPITYTTPDGRLIEGVVDLAFEEQGRWYVIDYKTDRDPLAVDGVTYQRQVALYCAAIASATDLPASGVLIRV